MATAKFETLHCEVGDHPYDWPVKRGRKPKNCEAHKPLAAERAERSPASITAALTRVLTSPVADSCRCGITTTTTAEQLRKLGAGCTAPWHVCGLLDSARRAIA